MASRADFNVDFGLGRAGRELVAASTADVSVYILGMYTGLHSVIECSGPDLTLRGRIAVTLGTSLAK
jgi:hypothetical protein